MDPNFRRLMDQATRLTRAGALRAATAVIQSALNGGGIRPESRDARGEVIDVEAREVHDGEARAAHPVQARDISGADARVVHGDPKRPDVAGVAPDDTRPEEPPARGEPVRAVDPTSGLRGEGRFIDGSHAGAAGRRDYKLYMPPLASGGKVPLVVMLHGCTQDPDDFAAGTAMNELARAQGVFVLYPSQSAKANPRRCWNWFKHNHQRRGRGEPALIAGMTMETMLHHPIDPQRVFVAGLSAGGAMAAILGAEYPDLYAAVGIHSGLAAGAASDLQTALAAMKNGSPSASRTRTGAAAPSIVFHGQSDAIVHPSNAEHVITSIAGTDASVEVERFDSAGGRSASRRVHRGPDGRVRTELWLVQGAPHAWSGGRSKGSYTDPSGPDASAQMLRFFLETPRREAG